MLVRQCVLLVAVVGGLMTVGCKGGGGSASHSKPHLASESAGPALSSTDTRSTGQHRDTYGRDSESVAYYTERSGARVAGLATPQRTCPVDGRPLGEAGAPVTVNVQGEPIFVCCQACAKRAQKEPAKYLARVRKDLGGHD